MISVTFRASSGYLLRHPWQLLLAVLGIAVGVAVMVAVDLANASARKAFLLSMESITGKATHQVVGGPRGVADAVYSDLRIEHGFRSIAPVVEGTVYVDGTAVTLLGVDLFAEGQIRDFTDRIGMGADAESSREALIRRFLAEPGAVAMFAQTATDLGLVAGERFAITANSRTRQASLIALIPDEQSAGRQRLLICDIATAQEWLDQSGWLSRIDARLSESEAQALASALPEGTRLLSAAGRSRATADMSNAFMTNLTAMSLLALLVGIFLIFNSVSFSVVQRRGLIGVLRALGVTRRQVMSWVLAEAGLVGLFSALIGVAAGVVLGEALLELVARTINDLYFRLLVTDVAVEAGSIARGLGAGVAAALLAAFGPAWEATSYPPRLALMRSALEQKARSAVPLASLSGLAMIAVAGLLLLASGVGLIAGLTAVFLLILGFALLIPALVRLAVRLAAPLADKLGGAPARMTVTGIAAGLSRTATAVVALSVAVSATIGVSVMVDSFRGSVNEWLEDTLRADLYAAVRGGAMDPALIEAARALDGVEAVSTSRRVWLEDRGGRTQLRVIEMAPGSYAGTELLDGDPQEVWPAWEGADVVLVSEPYAFQQGVRAGDVISLPTDAGRRDFEVIARFQSYDINASAVLMSRATYARHFDDDRVDSLGIYLAEGASADATAAALQSLAGGRDLLISSNADLRERSLRIFDRTFVITDVLYWLALGVAFIGILSALLALQLERAREFGTLRALGMTPRQVGGMVVAQSGVIGLLSGLASIPLGVLMALVLIKVINRRAFGWQIDMAVSADILVLSIAFAIAAAVLAGLYPAYRAGHAQPALAMREE